MKLLEFIQRLDELRLRYKSPGNPNNYDVISFRGNVWLIDDNDPNLAQVQDDIEQQTGADVEQELEERPDIIHAFYNPNDNSLWMGRDQELGHHPRASVELKKLVQFLGVDAVEGNRTLGYDDQETRHSKYEMEGKVPDKLYHGTDVNALGDIIRVGLVPERGEGNWQEVGQFDAVYLAADWHKAAFHAVRQSIEGRGAPIVLKVKVPDPSQIVPDFDAMTTLGGDEETADQMGYTGTQGYHQAGNVNQRDKIQQMNPGAANLPYISGVIGYKGRIPANHIQRIDVDLRGDEFGSTEEPDFTPFQMPQEIDELRDALELYGDYGYWYPGMRDELDMYDDEDEDLDEDLDDEETWRQEFADYKRRPQDTEHEQAVDDTGFWGKAGAGVLFQAADTGRVLFSHRSPDVMEPNTWGTWGGAMDEGESPVAAAAREAYEETGFKPSKEDIIPLHVFEHESGFRYFNFLIRVPQEFEPFGGSWESQGHEWVDVGNWPQPLHFGAADLLNDQRSLAILKQGSTV